MKIPDAGPRSWTGTLNKDARVKMVGTIAAGVDIDHYSYDKVTRDGIVTVRLSYDCTRNSPNWKLPDDIPPSAEVATSTVTPEPPMPRGLSRGRFADGANYVGLDGEIYEGLSGVIEPYLANSATIVLNSNGGRILDAIKIATYVHAHNINAYVPQNSVCNSACFIVFACSAQKAIDATAHIGIHSASNVTSQQEDLSSYSTDTQMARYIKQCGVPDSIIGRMVTTPAHELYQLTPDDLRAMGVAVGSW